MHKNFIEQILKKQFPTVLGILVLVIALVAGLALLGQGSGVFAPRATPQTTPKKIKLTNLSDTGFSVSFVTDESTTGFIKYGESANSTQTQVSDDRDQLSGTVGKFTTHHISVRGLKPDTTYYYLLGTGSGSTFDSEGVPFNIKTFATTSNPSPAKTVHGTVNDSNGAMASGAIVYLTIPGSGQLSTLVKDSGNWAIPLATARQSTTGAFTEITDQTTINIAVQGLSASQTAVTSVAVANAQPVAAISLGGTVGQGGEDSTADPALTATKSDLNTANEASEAGTDTMSGNPSDDQDLLSLDLDSQVEPGGLASALEATPESEIGIGGATEIDLTNIEEQTVTTSQPVISGQAAPSVKVSITVNSNTQINQEVVTDADGNFVLDISQLGDNLEPGEHTVTYSYIDPTTGEEVIKTQTFIVSDTDTTSLAQANNGTNYPYGTGSPYTIGGASSSGTATSSGTSSATSSGKTNEATQSATSSGRASLPATNSALPTSGSVGTTLALVFGGFFFIGAGAWSYYLASRFETVSSSEQV